MEIKNRIDHALFGCYVNANVCDYNICTELDSCVKIG